MNLFWFYIWDALVTLVVGLVLATAVASILYVFWYWVITVDVNAPLFKRKEKDE